MSLLAQSILDIRNLDLMARGSTPLHRLDPRAKLITTLVFLFTVISVDKYALAQLIPFLVYPVALVAVADLPPGFFLKKICLVAPFALLVGIFNPLFDRNILLHIGPIGISGGWLSFASLLFRFVLTVGTGMILIALTGFTGLCLALAQLRVPRIFVLQLLFLYRYIFVLTEEALRMSRARALRTFNTRGPGLKTFSSMAGNLLLRATCRAERVHQAMRCRGFDGNIRLPATTSFGIRDLLFVAGWSSLFLLLRLYNLPEIIGAIVLEAIA